MFANVRNNDPDTSHAAAAANKNNYTDRAFVLAAYFRSPDGLTDYDLVDLTKNLRQQNSLGKRRGELKDAGLLRATNRRRKGHTKSNCIVWEITAFGITAYVKGWPLDNNALEQYALTNGIVKNDTRRKNKAPAQKSFEAIW